jgi:mannosyltransferase
MDARRAPPSRWFAWTALAILGLGTAVALVGLGRQSLWLDETYTWFFARLDWSRFLEAARIDAVNPPLFYVVVKALAPSGNLAEAPLRLPSALAQILGITGAILLGYRLGGEAGGLASGLIWAAQPLLVWASQDARPYSLAAMLAVGTLAVFVSMRQSPSVGGSAAAFVLVSLGLLTHYFFFVFAGSLIVVALLEVRRSPQLFRRWTLITLAALVPLGIWLAWFFSQGSPSLGIGWIRKPTLVDIPLTLWNLVSGYAGVPDGVSTALGVAVAGLVGFGLVAGDRHFARSLAIGGLLAPVAAVWVISQRRPVYVDRYFILLMPFVAALAALGASDVARMLRGRRNALGLLVALAVVVAAASVISVRTAPKFEKEDWRHLVADLRSERATGEIVSLSEPEITLPLAYYGFLQIDSGIPPLIPACAGDCWWILRQPYTATHALTQAVVETGRGEPAPSTKGCATLQTFEDPGGVSAWQLSCPR